VIRCPCCQREVSDWRPYRGVAGLSLAGVTTALAAWFGDTLPFWVRSWLLLG